MDNLETLNRYRKIYEDKKQLNNERSLKRYAENKDEIREYMKNRNNKQIECEICHKLINYGSLKAHQQTTKCSTYKT